jgi:signal transduction histidine kinase
LSYVANIVEKCKGKIVVESIVGEGSKFIIYLPISYEF